MKRLILFSFFFVNALKCLNAQNIAYKQKTGSDSHDYRQPSFYLVDGKVSDISRWVSEGSDRDARVSHWAVIDWEEEIKIGTIDVYTGYRNGDAIKNFVFQTFSNGNWKDIKNTRISNNTKNEIRIALDNSLKTQKIRLYIEDPGSGSGRANVREIKVWAPTDQPLAPLEILRFNEENPNRYNPRFPKDRHLVFLNQVGFNLNWPKRFTAPLSSEDTDFRITPVYSDKTLYRGKIKNHIGDFSDFKEVSEINEFVIRVSGGNLKEGTSVPFSIAPFLFERVTLENAVRHFVDDRSITGTHPGAFGAAPWRDAPFYAYCIPSLVSLYLTNPSFCNHLPVEMNWEKDIKRVLSPDFNYDPGSGENALEVVKRMYLELDAPVGDNVPDVVQLIHWGISWWYIKPESKDYAGSDYKLHPETISVFSYFLYGYPWYKDYFTDKFYQTIKAYTFECWEKYGLLEVDKTIGTFKGRYAPGWTVMPNLMMYEIAKREGYPDAEKFIRAAFNQVQWIIKELDFNDPLVTKGQRMSEHKMMTGLYTFYKNYPKKLPEGFKKKIRQLADLFISRSDNYWDFRKYDEGENWTLPRSLPGHTGGGTSWNEPGNLAGFPAVAWNINRVLSNLPEDKRRKERLNILAVAHFDNLYGRNPLGYHTAFRGVKDFKGVEVAWPIQYNPNACARLHLVRGTICSSAATEHYPFNPNGKFRHAEGWTAFNAALNMGLAAASRENTTINLIRIFKGVEITVEGPVFGAVVTVQFTTSSGENETFSLPAMYGEDTKFRLTLPVIENVPLANDGKLQLNPDDEITLTYGYGFYKSSVKRIFSELPLK